MLGTPLDGAPPLPPAFYLFLSSSMMFLKRSLEPMDDSRPPAIPLRFFITNVALALPILV